MTTDLTTITPQQREILWKMAEQAKVSPNQFAFMLELAKKYKLDPFARQIYATPKGIIVGRDGYLALAWRSGKFNGMKTDFIDDEKGNPIKAITTVWRKDIDQPFTEPAYWSEYHKDTEVWDKYKHPMLQKCSERAALSKAFAISGLYADAELEDMDDPELADNIEYVDAEVIRAPVTHIEDIEEPVMTGIDSHGFNLDSPAYTMDDVEKIVANVRDNLPGQSISDDELIRCRRDDKKYDKASVDELRHAKFVAWKASRGN